MKMDKFPYKIAIRAKINELSMNNIDNIIFT